MKIKTILLISCLLSGLIASAKSQTLTHGDIDNRTRNIHSGNLIRVTFYNHDMMGSIKGDQSLIYGGEWPINTGLVQMGNTSGYVGTEIKLKEIDVQAQDTQYVTITPVVFSQGWDPNMFSHDSLGNFLGFEPLPGYFNVDNPDPVNKAAMSHQPISWPAYWPDKTEDLNDPGWKGKWNGYFGKGVFNADQESYFVNDDYYYKKKIGIYSPPPPITNEPLRGGLGIKKLIRGLQWSNPDAEDCIFWIYDIHNIGELKLKKTVFGFNVGAAVGAKLGQNTDWMDDCAKFYREIGLTVNWDYDNVGTAGYSPVPWVGFAFLESPGNAFDGIDNDGDGLQGSGRIITQSDFVRFVGIGEPIVLIDYSTTDYTRTVTSMPTEGITFTVDNLQYKKFPNTPLEELPRNGIDDNLNGIIDESDGAEITETGEIYYLYLRSIFNNQDYICKDYITGVGLDNLMIDEKRDDGIDNDGDWDATTDDVGMDGKEGTGDQGEGDGIPTAGIGELPGEPNIDRVDVSESDQIGLTSFIFYEYSSLTYSNDDQMWFVSRPGFFDGHLENVDADYIFSCGYFPLLPGQKESFSIGMIYGWDEKDILRNKSIVQTIYDANYNFAVAPLLPTLRIVAGDRKVTLYWDEIAEESKDRYLREYDFEGYKIYRATDPGFVDAGEITDGHGYARAKKPIDVFDKINNISGFFPESFGTGTQFYLGSETGLVHTYIDSPLVNGKRYFYAVTAYDRGSIPARISPSETSKYVTIDASGNVETGQNVAWAIPASPSSGYVAPSFPIKPTHIGSDLVGHAQLEVNIMVPDSIKQVDDYEIQFIDCSMDRIDNNGNKLIDMDDPDEIIPSLTTGFILKKTTLPENPIDLDTIFFFEYRQGDSDWVEIKNLYMDDDKNNNTLRATSHGLDFWLLNPSPGILTDTMKGIRNGIKWSSAINSDYTYNLDFGLWDNVAYKNGVFYPRCYKVVFHDEIVDSSQEIYLSLKNNVRIKIPAKPVNFRIYDLLSNQEMSFGFRENLAPGKTGVPYGYFSAKDEIWFMEKLPNDSIITTFYILNNSTTDSADFINYYSRRLSSGDTLYLFTESQYTSQNRFRFAVTPARIDTSSARAAMDNIKVVPNPYVVTVGWEPKNPYTDGRGSRAIRFIHLPSICTIRIYSIDGTLIQTINHQAGLADGSAEWDLLTRDNMDISYGIYIYHVDAPGIGEKVGKIIIIK